MKQVLFFSVLYSLSVSTVNAKSEFSEGICRDFTKKQNPNWTGDLDLGFDIELFVDKDLASTGIEFIIFAELATLAFSSLVFIL